MNPFSQPCGTWCASIQRRDFAPGFGSSPSASARAGRSARSFTDTTWPWSGCTPAARPARRLDAGLAEPGLETAPVGRIRRQYHPLGVRQLRGLEGVAAGDGIAARTTACIGSLYSASEL